MAHAPSFAYEFPYASGRMPVLADNVVATSQPLAAQAGLSMLARGGSAVDAALAAAIALTVVEPVSNGLGSDAFAIVWDGAALHGLNGSGRSPVGWTRERFKDLREMPLHGWDAVTVPGAVSLWAELHARLGRLPFETLFEPAVRYAESGYPVSPITARRWADAAPAYGRFPDFAATFLPNGRAPRSGERFVCRDMARSLVAIAESRGESFYRGSLAEAIVAASRAGGGVMSEADLAAQRAEWVGTIQVPYRGCEVHEIPPNGQGLAALVALGVLDRFELTGLLPDDPRCLHLQVEAMRQGFRVANRYVADAAHMEKSVAELLDPALLDALAKEIRLDRVMPPGGAPLPDHGTVYLCAADASGMMVSLIQSNFTGFGSGMVVPGAGISLQNRGRGFVLTPGHPNEVGPGKRPYHTIIPGFLTCGGEPVAAFGVMGGHMQPQGHVQVLSRCLDFGQNPQAASDAPRWHLCEDGQLCLESGTSDAAREALADLGHEVRPGDPVWGYGGCQMIWRLAGGGCIAASDHRKDGQAVGF